MKVVPKKHLGQHFLKDVQLQRIADAILINELTKCIRNWSRHRSINTIFNPKNFHWLPMKLTLNQSNICHSLSDLNLNKRYFIKLGIGF